ncbi:hypothetical protein [Vibrio anguillarum]|uniref:hypothetical protein n=1 Tax=Vibrio anguillarum TaxID=55601 RepID=UPI00097E3A8F|nr:hypothetical protein [Vibrio anguillarum]AQM18222.1 hypothetical protein PN51_00020 [Vibrio anguillarum]AUB86611.1 hypothetical protein CKY00_04495 [Vibrio anguillarum]AUB90049.1 hypothetical protein CKX99_04505 [Vibrio anguillarum]AUB93489.1 hypothetical protein CK210_04500 [Vibrio anguillarum]AUB96909.1 hypothetical protein CK209_04435 [Vibrio anguillarum]
MQQGMLSSLLLSLFLFCAWPSAASIEITSDTAQKWLQEEQIRHKSAELLQYAVHDEFDSLRFSLQRLALLPQEAARFLLLQKIEQLDLALTPNMVIFIEEQQALAPTYQVVEKEQGYEFSTPAFDSSAIASRLLKRWRQEQTILDFLVKAERQELVLKTWLSGTQYQVKIRETLLIRELDTLSPSALAVLTEQLTSEPVTGWLPSTQVMVRLAQVSEDPKIYKLLWLMRVDFSIQQELTRLAGVSDEFAIKQIMAASENPSLKVQAIKALVRISPMRPDIRDFLIAKMSINEEVNLVATALVEQGHSRWLKDLLVSNSQVKSRGILQALSQ